MKRLGYFALVLSLLVSSCSIQKAATKTTAKIMYDATRVVETEQDLDLARQSALTSLKTLEGLYFYNPKDPTTLLLLTRSYASIAFGFTENDMLRYKGNDPVKYDKAHDRAKLFYERARRYGLELLSQRSGWTEAFDGSVEDFQTMLKKFGPKDLENLFWTGFAWGNYLNFNRDSIEALGELPKVEALMNRVLEIDEDYQDGGVHLFLGALNASRPAALGGNPEKAKEEFDRAIEIESRNLMSKVAKAQFYAVQIQDSALFVQLLKEVQQADPAALPRQRLMNEIALERAGLLLAQEKALFTR